MGIRSLTSSSIKSIFPLELFRHSEFSTIFQHFLSLANKKKFPKNYCIKISHKIHDSHVRETNETTLTSEILFYQRAKGKKFLNYKNQHKRNKMKNFQYQVKLSQFFLLLLLLLFADIT